MASPKPQEPDPSTYTPQYTPHGSPYILLTTLSPTQIYLTPLKPLDAPLMARTLAIPSLNHTLIGAPAHYTLDSANYWINLQLSGKSDLRLCALRVGDPEDGDLIGSVALAPQENKPSRQAPPLLPGEKRTVELGYWLNPEYRKKGIMQAGVKTVIAWAREHENVGTVIVRVLEDNIPSQKIVGAFEGFKRVGDQKTKWPVEKGGVEGVERVLWVWEWRI